MEDVGAIRIRRASGADAEPLYEILNSIIRVGGTTGLQTVLSPAELDDHYIRGQNCLACFVAENFRGNP